MTHHRSPLRKAQVDRRWVIVCACATLVLIGFGCSRSPRPAVPEGGSTQPVAPAPLEDADFVRRSSRYVPMDRIVSADGGDRAEEMERIAERLRWDDRTRAYIDHPAIDMRIPYPKGWSQYVDRDEDGEVTVNFYDSPRIPESDFPDQYSFSRTKRSIAEIIEEHENVDVIGVRRSGIAMRRLRFSSMDDMFGPNVYWLSYLWPCGDAVCELSGWDDHPVLEAAVMSLVPRR